MADILYQHNKSDKQFAFQVNLHWMEASMGVLYAADVNGQMHVSLPEKFGGKGNEWSAEHLLLGALCSSFMNTYLAYAKKMMLSISHFECEVIGQIKIIRNRYQFTHINIYPKIFIVDKLQKIKAIQALRSTQKYCLIANTLATPITYHSEIITDEKFIKEAFVLKK